MIRGRGRGGGYNKTWMMGGLGHPCFCFSFSVGYLVIRFESIIMSRAIDMYISARRFFCLPSSVSLSAMGRSSPQPRAMKNAPSRPVF